MISIVVIVLHYLELIKLQPEFYYKVFLSVISNSVAWFTAVPNDITQFTDKVRVRLIPQLINGVSRVLKKLFDYFKGTITIISTSFVSPVSA